MTGISLDVVGPNTVVYASTGIKFFIFLNISQSIARLLFSSFPVKSFREQFTRMVVWNARFVFACAGIY